MVILLLVLVVLVVIGLCVYRISRPSRHSIEPIVPDKDMDCVISFVNDQDLVWKKSKQDYIGSHFNPAINNHDSINPSRFRNMDELKYALRSVDKFAPWIRYIYLVVATDAQVPAYINKNKGKLKVVLHSDFMPKEHLPTFNSHAIEVNLHKIKGLSNTFLYLNDDLFFGRPTTEADFISEDKAKFFPTHKASPKGHAEVTEHAHSSAWKNVNAYLDKKYGPMDRSRIHHTAAVLKKNVMDKIWKDLHVELSATSAQKFRSIKDYNMTCALHQYYTLHNGIGVPANLDIFYTEIANDADANDIKFDRIKDETPFVFCLNDTTAELSPETVHQVNEFLEQYFPDKSSFEL